MTTPFKALNPLTPRFVEINYVAPDGGCCAISSSSGSYVSYPDIPPVPEPENHYYFNVPVDFQYYNFWVQDVNDPSQRVLLGTILIETLGLYEITHLFELPENTSMPGTQRKFFITRFFSDSSSTYEVATNTTFLDETGDFSLEDFTTVPPMDGISWYSGLDDVGMVVIENYITSSATFEIADRPLPPDA